MKNWGRYTFSNLTKLTVSLQIPGDIGAGFDEFNAIMARKRTPDPQNLVFLNAKHFTRNRRQQTCNNRLDQIL